MTAAPGAAHAPGGAASVILRREVARMKSVLLAGASSLPLLSGCTLEPHYSRPAATGTADVERSRGAADRCRIGADIGWRQFFPDPTLQRLIKLALDNNRDLRVAVLNVQAAQAQYRIQRADLFPTVAASGIEQVQKYPSGVLATGLRAAQRGASAARRLRVSGGTTIRFFEAGVGFTSYELDLFGKIRSLDRAALERYFGTEETRRSSQLTLVAEVASAYLAVLADETILKVTRETLDSQTESYDLIKRSLDAGTTTALALRQAATTVDTARANLAQYTRQAAQDRNALMLLIGVPMPDGHPVQLGFRCREACRRSCLWACRPRCSAPAGCPGGGAPADRGQRGHRCGARGVLSQHFADRQRRYREHTALGIVQAWLDRLVVLAADLACRFLPGAPMWPISS